MRRRLAAEFRPAERSALSVLGALLCLPLADGRSYRLNDAFPLVPSVVVTAFDVSPDGAWIVYRISSSGSPWNLYSVRADGSGAERALTANTDPLVIISDLSISPDGTRVLYTTNEDGKTLHSVRIDGSSAPIDLSPRVAAFQVTSDSARVVFTADLFTAG